VSALGQAAGRARLRLLRSARLSTESGEKWFSPDTVQALQKMGYRVQFGLREGSDAGSYWSDAECIAVDPKTGDRLGASDYRNGGKAVGY